MIITAGRNSRSKLHFIFFWHFVSLFSGWREVAVFLVFLSGWVCLCERRKEREKDEIDRGRERERKSERVENGKKQEKDRFLCRFDWLLPPPEHIPPGQWATRATPSANHVTPRLPFRAKSSSNHPFQRHIDTHFSNFFLFYNFFFIFFLSFLKNNY